MMLSLTPDQATELHHLLETTLSDLNYELAATENHAYRQILLSRRRHLSAILEILNNERTTNSLVLEHPSSALYKELEHPGD